MRKFLIIFVWLLSLVAVGLYVYENPDRIDLIKYDIKKYLTPEVKSEKSSAQRALGNFFAVDFSREVDFSEKTAFVFYDESNESFNKNNLKIYFQSGYLSENFKVKKLNLPETFTLSKNGGVKTLIIYNENEFAFISSKEKDCFYTSLVMLNKKKEIFKTKCLPSKNLDYNGIGSSFIHHNEKIFLSIGTPEQVSLEISKFSQDQNSMYGKIVEINKADLNEIISEKKETLTPEIFSLGHRNPQGLTKINNSFFSVEHGPKGGDELNKIIKGKNYGWPIVSYGRKYDYDKEEKSYEMSHEKKHFEEPLFAINPSVGISALNVCPSKLNNYYKKPCLIALSLYGNDLRPGKSLIIFLLNEKMDRIHSVEQIFLNEELKLRHFVTNSKNNLYEDKNGNIYVSADRKGIYKLNFTGFVN